MSQGEAAGETKAGEMSVEPFKWLLQPVCVERDESGRVTREIPGEILQVFSAAQAVEAIDEFEAKLQEMVTANGSGP